MIGNEEFEVQETILLSKVELNPNNEGNLIDLINFYIDSGNFAVAQKKAAEYLGASSLQQSLAWHKCLSTLYKHILERPLNDGEDKEEADYLVGAALIYDNYLSILHRSRSDHSLEETASVLKQFDQLLWKLCHASFLSSAVDLYVKRHFLAQLAFHIAVMLLITAKKDRPSQDEAISLCSLALLFAQSSPFSSATARSLLLSSKYRGRTKHFFDSAIYRVIQANLTLRTWSKSTSSDEFTIRTHEVSEAIRRQIFSNIFSESKFEAAETSCWLTAKEFCELRGKLLSITEIITEGNLLSFQRQCFDSLHHLVWLGVQLLIQNVAETSELILPLLFNISFRPRVVTFSHLNEVKTTKFGKVDFDTFLFLSIYCSYFQLKDNKPSALLSDAMPVLPTKEQYQFWSALKASQENELNEDLALIFIQGLDTIRLKEHHVIDPELSVYVARTLKNFLSSAFIRQSPDSVLMVRQRAICLWNDCIDQFQMLREKRLCARSVNIFFPHQSNLLEECPSEIDEIIEEGLSFLQLHGDYVDSFGERKGDHQRLHGFLEDKASSNHSSPTSTALGYSPTDHSSFRTSKRSPYHWKGSEPASPTPEKNVEVLAATNIRLLEVVEKLAKRLETLETSLPSKNSDPQTEDINQVQTPSKLTVKSPSQVKDQKIRTPRPSHHHPVAVTVFHPHYRPCSSYCEHGKPPFHNQPVLPVSPHYHPISPPGYYPTSPMLLPHELPPVHSHRHPLYVNPAMSPTSPDPRIYYQVPPPDIAVAPPFVCYSLPPHHLNSPQSQVLLTRKNWHESNFESQSSPSTPQNESTKQSPVSQEQPSKKKGRVKSGARSPIPIWILPEEPSKSKEKGSDSSRIASSDLEKIPRKDLSILSETLCEAHLNEQDFPAASNLISSSSTTSNSSPSSQPSLLNPKAGIFSPDFDSVNVCKVDSDPESALDLMVLNPNAAIFSPDHSDNVNVCKVDSDSESALDFMISAAIQFCEDNIDPNPKVSIERKSFSVLPPNPDLTCFKSKIQADINANYTATGLDVAKSSRNLVNPSSVIQSSPLLKPSENEVDQRWKEAASKVDISVSKRIISEAEKEINSLQTKSAEDKEFSVQNTVAVESNTCPKPASSEYVADMMNFSNSTSVKNTFSSDIPTQRIESRQGESNILQKKSAASSSNASSTLNAAPSETLQDHPKAISLETALPTSEKEENLSALVIINDTAKVYFDEPCKWSKSRFFSSTMKWVDKLLDKGRMKIVFDPNLKLATLHLERSKIYGSSISQRLSTKLTLVPLVCSSRAWIWNDLDSNDRKIIVLFTTVAQAQKLLSVIGEVKSLICKHTNNNLSENSGVEIDLNADVLNANSSAVVTDSNGSDVSFCESNVVSNLESSSVQSQSRNCNSSLHHDVDRNSSEKVSARIETEPLTANSRSLSKDSKGTSSDGVDYQPIDGANEEEKLCSKTMELLSAMGSESARSETDSLSKNKHPNLNESLGSAVVFGELKSFKFNLNRLRLYSESLKKSNSRNNGESSDFSDTHSEVSAPNKPVLITGEEDETALFQHPAKLFRFTDGEWKERGTGDFKILQHRTKDHFRFVMRRKPIDMVCLNHFITKDLNFSSKDSRSWSWTALDFSQVTNSIVSEKTPDIFSVRFETSDVAKKFKSAIDFCLGECHVLKSAEKK